MSIRSMFCATESVHIFPDVAKWPVAPSGKLTWTLIDLRKGIRRVLMGWIMASI